MVAQTNCGAMAPSGSRLLSLAQSALGGSWRAVRGPQVFGITSHPHYVTDFRDNLLESIERNDFEQDLLRGDGNEFGWRNRGRSPPKFHAAYSSSALQVNTFAPFRSRIGDLVLFGASRFASLRFEAQLATGLARSPNIDVLCEGDDVVAIESKCLEFLYPGAAKDARRKASQPPFRPSYAAIEHHLDSNFRQLYDEIRADPGIFAPVDAAQLVKHCFGLRMAYGRRAIVLAYLFWEPSDSNRYAVFAEHRHQIARVAQILSGSSVSFAAMSYAELFQTWLDASTPQWLADHITKLRQRYDVPLTPANACGGGRI